MAYKTSTWVPTCKRARISASAEDGWCALVADRCDRSDERDFGAEPDDEEASGSGQLPSLWLSRGLPLLPLLLRLLLLRLLLLSALPPARLLAALSARLLAALPARPSNRFILLCCLLTYLLACLLDVDTTLLLLLTISIPVVLRVFIAVVVVAFCFYPDMHVSCFVALFETNEAISVVILSVCVETSKIRRD